MNTVQVEELFQLHINPSFLKSPAEFKFKDLTLIFSKPPSENSIKIKLYQQISAELKIENISSIEVNGKEKISGKDQGIIECNNANMSKISNEIELLILSSNYHDMKDNFKNVIQNNNDKYVKDSNDTSYENSDSITESCNKINGIETNNINTTNLTKFDEFNDQKTKLLNNDIYRKFSSEYLSLDPVVTDFNYEHSEVTNKTRLLDPLITLSTVIDNFIKVKDQWVTISKAYHTSSTYYHVGPRYWVRDLLDNMYKVFDALHNYNTVAHNNI